MKIPSLLLTFALLAACSSPSNDATTTASDSAATAAPPPATTIAAPVAASTAAGAMPSMPMSASPAASATGVVKAVDPVAKTITLDHGPVAALHWPAMIMTFKTGDLDLASIKPGDHVAFEFTASGMEATLTKIDRQ